MLWVPQKGVQRVEHNTGVVGAVNVGTTVTTGAAATTKGTPAELITSTAFDSYWMVIIASRYGSTAVACAGSLDILTGAATEDILIADLLMGYCGGDNALANPGSPKVWEFPLYVPAGTRIAAQAAGERTTSALSVAIFLYGGSGYPAHRVGSKVVTYGMGTVPNGVSITPGASGAEGTWTQIVAASTADHFAFVPSFQVSADTTVNGKSIALDLGVGAATEEEIMQSYWYNTNAAEQMGGPFNPRPCFQEVPSGTRLAMRASNHSTNDGAYNGVIHGVSA